MRNYCMKTENVFHWELSSILLETNLLAVVSSILFFIFRLCRSRYLLICKAIRLSAGLYVLKLSEVH